VRDDDTGTHLLRGGREVAHEACLAHARVTADEQDPGLADRGALERAPELGDLLAAAHQRDSG
jgi:hypothetical protein